MVKRVYAACRAMATEAIISALISSPAIMCGDYRSRAFDSRGGFEGDQLGDHLGVAGRSSQSGRRDRCAGTRRVGRSSRDDSGSGRGAGIPAILEAGVVHNENAERRARLVRALVNLRFCKRLVTRTGGLLWHSLEEYFSTSGWCQAASANTTA